MTFEGTTICAYISHVLSTSGWLYIYMHIYIYMYTLGPKVGIICIHTWSYEIQKASLSSSVEAQVSVDEPPVCCIAGPGGGGGQGSRYQNDICFLGFRPRVYMQQPAKMMVMVVNGKPSAPTPETDTSFPHCCHRMSSQYAPNSRICMISATQKAASKRQHSNRHQQVSDEQLDMSVATVA